MKKNYTVIRCIVISLIACLLLCGCVTKYVPVVEHHTETVHETDTIKITDSVKTNTNTIIREARPEDSLLIASLGIRLKENERLLILLQKELTEAKSEKIESHSKDSVRVDSIPVPYPVEKKLTRWEQFTLNYGAVAFGGSVVGILLLLIELIRWLRRRKE